MKYTIATVLLAAATTALAGPTTKPAIPSGLIFPTALATHNLTSNLNTPSLYTTTIRTTNTSETSTLYSLTFPPSLAGKTCGLLLFAGAHDTIQGSGQMDFFSTRIRSLATEPAGNLRGRALGRVQFDAGGGPGLYRFVRGSGDPAAPWIREFACPAGQSVVLEGVAVGEEAVHVVRQDFGPVAGVAIPNGLTIGYV